MSVVGDPRRYIFYSMTTYLVPLLVDVLQTYLVHGTIEIVVAPSD